MKIATEDSWYQTAAVGDGVTHIEMPLTPEKVFGVTRKRGSGRMWTLFAMHPDAAEKAGKPAPVWSTKVPEWSALALLPAGPTLFVAGPLDQLEEIAHQPAQVDPLAEALLTKRGGRLLAVSTKDGKTLADYELTSPPVFDGMAAAGGRLYLSTKNGQVVCMTGPDL